MHLLPSKISAACASLLFCHHCFAPPPHRLAIKLVVLVAPSLPAWISPLCTVHFLFFFHFWFSSITFFCVFLCMLLSFHRCRRWGTLMISATTVSGKTLGCSSSSSKELEESSKSWSLFLFLLSLSLLFLFGPPSSRSFSRRRRHCREERSESDDDEEDEEVHESCRRYCFFLLSSIFTAFCT